MNICQHCGETVTAKFCSNCGQKRNDGKISTSEITSFFAQEVFSFESKLIKTMLILFTKPGIIAKQFINGDRTTYYHPVKYFILMGAFSIFLRFLLNYDPVFVGVSGIAEKHLQNDKIKNIIEIGQFLVKNNTYLIILLLLLISSITKFFNMKKTISYIEFVVFYFFILGQQFVIVSFFTLFTVFNPKFFFMANIIQIPYLIFGLGQFLGEKGFKKKVKNTITIGLSYIIFIVMISIVFVLVVI